MMISRTPRVFVALLLAVLALSEARAAETPIPERMQLFLLIGQSNMAGRGAVEASDKVPHPHVFVLTKDLSWAPATDPLHFDKPDIVGVGLGLTFGRTIADAK